MNDTDQSHQEMKDQILNLEETMEELRLLNCLAQDLRSFRKMLKLKKYD